MSYDDNQRFNKGALRHYTILKGISSHRRLGLLFCLLILTPASAVLGQEFSPAAPVQNQDRGRSLPSYRQAMPSSVVPERAPHHSQTHYTGYEAVTSNSTEQPPQQSNTTNNGFTFTSLASQIKKDENSTEFTRKTNASFNNLAEQVKRRPKDGLVYSPTENTNRKQMTFSSMAQKVKK